MFNISENEITFESIETFCKKWAEGVCVEYKQEIAHIPKIVSSFANTQGGIFIVGVRTDSKNKVIFPIEGIPQKSGIEEQIQQSALTGIYPGVRPDIIKVVDVPNTENVVVVIRVNESPHAPHAIQNSTKTYIRTGSITQPYELADMDRIQYMFKRREDAQVVTRQILNRIEERTQRLNCGQGIPNITVIAKPVFPYRPVISLSEIFELAVSSLYHAPQRVTGGVCCILQNAKQYEEVNEYGIAYLKSELSSDDNKDVEYLTLRDRIEAFIRQTSRFYKKIDYLGNVEVRVHLKEVFDTILKYNQRSWVHVGADARHCFDSDVLVTEQCLSHDLYDLEKCKKVCEKLIYQLLWAYNISNNELVRERVENSLASFRL